MATATKTTKKESKKPTISRERHTIDATDKVLGRLATEIATLLRGKHKPTYQPHVDNGDFVVVKNFSAMKVTGKKMEQKMYYRHSGYPGGLTEKTMEKMQADKPGEILRLAVWNMLPKNKLRSEMIKRLSISN